MTRPSGKINWEFWIPALFLSAVVAHYLILPSLWNVHSHMNAAHWSEVDGRVTVSKEYEVRAQERIITGYDFKYVYTVDGTSYQNDRYSFRYASGDKRLGVETHRPSDSVTVYYDPDSPSRSVINRSLSPWWNYFVLCSLVVLPIAIWIRIKRVISPTPPSSETPS